MSARALLLSLLARQSVLLKENGFRQRYPHPWLVWEAGAWNVPDAGEELGMTRFPSSDMSDCLPEGDVLCFELAPPEDDGTLALGRAPDCDLVVNDATVSRRHLQLGFDGERWWATPFPESARSTLNGEALDPQARTPLIEGARICVGDAELTFFGADGFARRVQRVAERTAKPSSSTGSD